MQHLPFYVSLIFILATIYTVFMFWKAARCSKKVIFIIGGWLLLQGMAGYMLFYTNTNAVPPRFLFLIAPPVLTVTILFFTKGGRRFIDKLETSSLILLNAVRIPVEIGLFFLFVNKAIPQVMTFEGRNLDVLSGISAVFIWFLYRKNLSTSVLFGWNIICLALLANIVTTAILAAPTPFQQIAFDQPNIGVLYFPMVWLPCCIVPLVFFSHLVMLRRIVLKRREIKQMQLASL